MQHPTSHLPCGEWGTGRRSGPMASEPRQPPQVGPGSTELDFARLGEESTVEGAAAAAVTGQFGPQPLPAVTLGTLREARVVPGGVAPDHVRVPQRRRRAAPCRTEADQYYGVVAYLLCEFVGFLGARHAGSLDLDVGAQVRQPEVG